MGYRIQYDPEKNKMFPIKRNAAARRWLAGVAAASILLFGVIEWRQGTFLKHLLLPGDPGVTEAALSAMVEDIRAGESVGDALTTFCLEILANAEKES